ncbi:IclR family transcriptional regulator C-terminal domain-containing protein [Streptomyces sp. NPDC086766]|uniref:IclR family transcriptional regulator domain-containing protein n=1 Tax=Streptomyces sp. NPDC086766 TaxID=3365754 RepID=UPI0038074D67
MPPNTPPVAPRVTGTGSPAAATAPTAAVPPAEAVTPLMRGVAVLRQLTEAGGTLSPSALERATGLARSTVDRITATLARMGYVRPDGRDVVLAPRLMELGNAYLAALRLPALLDARADALADELDESVSLAVGDRDGIRFIHQATRRRAMSLSFRIGDLLPAERTAPGPLFASEWTDADWRLWHARRAADPEDRGFTAVPPRVPPTDGPWDATEAIDVTEAIGGIGGISATDAIGADFERRAASAREDGWSLDDQLIEPGLVAVSVPVRHPDTGRIACVASVVSHTSRHSADDLRTTLLPRLRRTVAAMEADLRAAPPLSVTSPPSNLATWTAASKQELGREFVESLARGLTVLTAFGEGRAALTSAQVARATGLSRATARRALITYEHLGLVRQEDDRTFTLTPRVLALGFPPLSRTSLPRMALPHLEELASHVQESTSLAVLTPSGEEIQYTARATTARIMSVDITVGTRLPAHATALGRVLLSDTPPVRQTHPESAEHGYALVDEELEAGLRSLAVPIHDRAGRVVAAAGVAMHTARHTREQCLEHLLPALRRTATAIEADLHVATHFTHVPLT